MNNTIKNVLRWIAVLPASLGGMMLVFGLWRIIHYITAYSYIDPTSWVNVVFVEVMSNLVAGVVCVFIGYKVAPNNKKIVAVVLAALLTMIAGSSLYIVNVMTKEYFSNIGILAGVVGTVAGCVSAYMGEFDKKE